MRIAAQTELRWRTVLAFAEFPPVRMADDMQDVRWKEFEELGEEKVRKLLSDWLELRSTSLAREANDLARKANDVAKEANLIARRNNSIAALALIGAAVAIAVSVIGLFLRRG